MIAEAKSTVLNNMQLQDMFKKCMDDVLQSKGIVIDTQHVLDEIRNQFVNKIMNARINEFFKTKKELDLEVNHKVVDCDQSLRDSLKTLSSMKSRI